MRALHCSRRQQGCALTVCDPAHATDKVRMDPTLLDDIVSLALATTSGAGSELAVLRQALQRLSAQPSGMAGMAVQAQPCQACGTLHQQAQHDRTGLHSVTRAQTRDSNTRTSRRGPGCGGCPGARAPALRVLRCSRPSRQRCPRRYPPSLSLPSHHRQQQALGLLHVPCCAVLGRSPATTTGQARYRAHCRLCAPSKSHMSIRRPLEDAH